VRDPAHGRALVAAGVALILNPFEDAADHAARRLAQTLAQTPTGDAGTSEKPP